MKREVKLSAIFPKNAKKEGEVGDIKNLPTGRNPMYWVKMASNFDG